MATIAESENTIKEEENIEVLLKSVDPIALEEAYKNFDSIQSKIEQFVDFNIAKMKEYTIKEVSPDKVTLTKAFIDWMPIHQTLEKMYSRCRSDLKAAERKLQLFEDQAYVATCNANGGFSTDKKNALSDKKVEALYRYKYRDHLSVLYSEVDLADSRRSFIERELKGWESYNYILGHLRAMYTSETKAFGDLERTGMNTYDGNNWAANFSKTN